MWNSFVLGIETVRFAGIPKRSMYNVTLLKGLPRTGAIYPMLVKGKPGNFSSPVLKEPSDNLPAIKKPQTPPAAVFSYQTHAMKFCFYWRHLSLSSWCFFNFKSPKATEVSSMTKEGCEASQSWHSDNQRGNLLSHHQWDVCFIAAKM